MTTYASALYFEQCETFMRQGNMLVNAGKMWSSIDEQAMCEMYDRGLELRELCKHLGRSPLGILERLKKYGRVRHENTTGNWEKCFEPIIDWKTNPYTSATTVGTQLSASAYTADNTATINTPKESNIMTKPLEHKAFLFGIEITKLSEEDLVRHIKRANDEINSYASIPDNKYTKLRIANLQDAIEAAVKELNKRGD